MVENVVVGSLCGFSIVGLCVLLLKRTFIRLLDHVDNQSIHIKQGNGYVSQTELEYKQSTLKSDIDEIKGHVQKLYDLQADALKEYRDSNKSMMGKIISIVEKQKNCCIDR